MPSRLVSIACSVGTNSETMSPFFISVALIKHPNKKPLKEEMVYFSAQFQVTIHSCKSGQFITSHPPSRAESNECMQCNECMQAQCLGTFFLTV